MRFVAGRGAKEVLLAEAPWRRCWQGAPWWICWPGRQGGAPGRGYRGEEDGGTVAGVAASGRNCGGWSSAQKNLPGYRGAKPWQVCDDYFAIKNALVFFLVKEEILFTWIVRPNILNAVIYLSVILKVVEILNNLQRSTGTCCIIYQLVLGCRPRGIFQF